MAQIQIGTPTAAEPTATVQGFEIGSEQAWTLLDYSGNVEWEIQQAIADREPLSELRDFYIDAVTRSAADQLEGLDAYDLDMGGVDARRDFDAGAERGARSVITVKRLREIAVQVYS